MHDVTIKNVPHHAYVYVTYSTMIKNLPVTISMMSCAELLATQQKPTVFNSEGAYAHVWLHIAKRAHVLGPMFRHCENCLLLFACIMKIQSSSFLICGPIDSVPIALFCECLFYCSYVFMPQPTPTNMPRSNYDNCPVMCVICNLRVASNSLLNRWVIATVRSLLPFLVDTTTTQYGHRNTKVAI